MDARMMIEGSMPISWSISLVLVDFFPGQLDSLLIRFLAPHIDNGFGVDYVGCPDRLGTRQAGEKKDSRFAKGKNITHQVGSSSRCDFFIETVMASYDLSLKEFFDFL